jgi:predicted TIM-barrel fold metal-dependent hydrolase
MIITDSGLHVWQAPTPEKPWNIAKAHLKDPMSYEDLRARMKEAGVDRAVLVPPSFAGGYNDYSLEAAAKYPAQFVVMCALKLNKPEAPRLLESFMKQPGALGVRLTFHHDYDESFIRDGTANWFWPVAEKMNIPVMMNAPSIHKDVARVAERHPNLRLILDHMGRQKGMKDDKLGAGLAPTIGLAKYPNVFVKLTSTPSCSSEGYPYRNIHFNLKQLIEEFGPRRCFWGTDLSAMLSRTNCTYRQAVTMFTEEMDFLPKEDLEFVMGRGLAECLPWP